jgi:hypothetical protein
MRKFVVGGFLLGGTLKNMPLPLNFISAYILESLRLQVYSTRLHARFGIVFVLLSAIRSSNSIKQEHCASTI